MAVLPEPKYTYELRPGLEVGPPESDDTVVFWLMIANDQKRQDFERIAAVVALFQKGVQLRVQQVKNG